MYRELVERLRNCATQAAPCKICDMIEDRSCSDTLMKQAADAIEELQKNRVCRIVEKNGETELFVENRWIPVAERLPEDLQNVLVIDDGRVTIGHCEHYYGDEVVYIEWHDTLYYPIDPPYWMPLPEPPKEE